MKLLRSVLFPQLAKLEHYWGITDMIRARVTWGQGLPSNLEARPVLVVPVHRHPLIPARWHRACGTSPGWGHRGARAIMPPRARLGDPLRTGDTYLLPFGSRGPLGSL